MSMLSQEARLLYRRLLKTQRRRFEGDLPVMLAAHKQTRAEFEANRSLTDEKKIKKSLKHGTQVEEVIRRYVVQGNKVEDKDNTYSIAFTSEHALRDAHPILIRSTLQNKGKKDK